MDETQALATAEALLEESWREGEPELSIDYGSVSVKNGLLIAPYNSKHFLETRRDEDMLLDCWPILVDLMSGLARFGDLYERHIWKD
jgi:hypothetical protein